MGKYLKIIKNNLQSIFSISNLCCMMIIFIYTFAVKYSSINNTDNFNIILKNIFIGPNNLSDNIFEFLIWILYQFFLIYMIGNYCFKEFDTRSIYTITRIGSKKYWNICIQITCFIVCLLYFIFGSIVAFICTMIVNKGIPLFNIKEAFKIIELLSISTYYIITLYILIIIISKKHAESFLILVTIICLSLEFGQLFKIDKYIPFNQGILSKHIISNFSYEWSFIFLTICIFINLMFINKELVKKDLLKFIH